MIAKMIQWFNTNIDPTVNKYIEKIMVISHFSDQVLNSLGYAGNS